MSAKKVVRKTPARRTPAARVSVAKKATKAEKPKAEKPKAEKPKAEKPKAEKPKAEKPKAEKPLPTPKAEKPLPTPKPAARPRRAPRPAPKAEEEVLLAAPAEAPIVDPSSIESTEAPRSEAPAPEPTPEGVADRIRALEERLGRMIEDASSRTLPSDEAAPPSVPPSRATLEPETEPTVFDTARELLSTDFYLRKWGRLGMRNRSEEVDDFGYDPVYDQKLQPLFDFLYERYFRVDCRGAEHVPAEGRCLLVANHSGTVPYDGLMLKLALRRAHPLQREVRWLAEDFVFHFPFLGSFVNRIGAVRACQENAERLLAQDALLAVFPEGTKGTGKLFRDRYRLQRFGRGGFVKLGLRTRTPIVPVAIVGGEETNPLLARLEGAGKALGLPYVPVTPTFPALGPVGLLPAPTKWRIELGPRIDLDEYGPESADDEILVGRLSERVRTTIQSMVDRSVAARRSVWFG